MASGNFNNRLLGMRRVRSLDHPLLARRCHSKPMTETPLTRLADEVAKLDEATQKRLEPYLLAMRNEAAEVEKNIAELVAGFREMRAFSEQKINERNEAVKRIGVITSGLNNASPN